MTDFLYPFIEGDEVDSSSLLADLASSAGAKASISAGLRAETLERLAPELNAAADAIASRSKTGGRVFIFGNGGSSTDAGTLAGLFARPPHGAPIAAHSLVDDTSILTALGNDVGFDLVFSRQLIAHGRSGDVAVGFSTSGGSRNLLEAFREAAHREMLTVGLAGYDGGEFATAGLDHCLIVRSDSVHRIQETQAAVAFELWRAVQERLS